MLGLMVILVNPMPIPASVLAMNMISSMFLWAPSQLALAWTVITKWLKGQRCTVSRF